MALIKSYTTPSDTTGNYWRISMDAKETFDGDLKVSARIALWIDVARWTAKKRPIFVVDYSWTWETLAQLGLTGQSTLLQTRNAVQTFIKNDTSIDLPDLGTGFFNDATIG